MWNSRNQEKNEPDRPVFLEQNKFICCPSFFLSQRRGAAGKRKSIWVGFPRAESFPAALRALRDPPKSPWRTWRLGEKTGRADNPVIGRVARGGESLDCARDDGRAGRSLVVSPPPNLLCATAPLREIPRNPLGEKNGHPASITATGWRDRYGWAGTRDRLSRWSLLRRWW